MSTDKHEQAYREAERAYLASEGLDASEQSYDLERVGTRLRTLSVGDGPTVVFVSGAMTTGVSYATLVRHLPDYRCVLIERPGTGLTAVPEPKPRTLAEHQRIADVLLVDLFDALGVDRARVVCTSMGGWPTFRGAAAHPERFVSIFAMAWVMGARVSSVPLSMRLPMPKAMMPKRIPFGGRRLVKGMLKSAGMKSAVENGAFSDEMLDYMAALGRHTSTMRNDSLYMPVPVSPRGGVKAVEAGPDLLARVTAKVDLFWGADDLFGSAESAQDFAAMLPNAELQLIEGAGHAPWLDELDMAVTALRSHLIASESSEKAEESNGRPAQVAKP